MGNRMMLTTDAEEFVAAPIGRCVVGATFAIWCDSPDLQGAIIWGAITDHAIRDMLAVGLFARHPALAARRRLLIDCRGVERVDADVLLRFTTLARDRVSGWNRGIEREAIALPAGLGGILLAGVLPSLGISHALRFAHDLDDALAFVDHPEAAAAHAAAAALADEARGHSALLFRLRAQLGRDLVAPSVEHSAAALGMSTRTLQRALGRLRTSFSHELRRVRIAAAEALLLYSDLKIDSIAMQVGFGTASRMSATLRSELNVTASALRARVRGDAPRQAA
jgi:AraC-like DNA-binding protein